VFSSSFLGPLEKLDRGSPSGDGVKPGERRRLCCHARVWRAVPPAARIRPR
jgi:hypothetical protein